ncbi:MAG TPA: ATP-binding protein [Methanotrichaceae archaeon]|nr:ATP-binding protein [Methanotrichaceae archaeon]
MQPEPLHIRVIRAADVSAARGAARAMALGIGFAATASEEIALAVSELASNLVKHAGGGTIVLLSLCEGMQIESHDEGSGIEDIDQALTDGFSTAGSLGFGLGTVNRLMDEFEISSRCSRPDSGTHIVCKRFIRGGAAGPLPGPLEFGAATRAHPLMSVNGDTFVIKCWGTSALIGVIDGLGHGQQALLAAQAARRYVEIHYNQPLLSIFTGVDRACRATRGVVMSLARFDWISDLSRVTLTFSGIGNVEMSIIGKQEPLNFVIRRGILGAGTPSPVVTEHIWKPGYVMVLHSDGISAHHKWSDLPELRNASVEVVAQHILQRLARKEDDATVIVARSKSLKNEHETGETSQSNLQKGCTSYE